MGRSHHVSKRDRAAIQRAIVVWERGPAHTWESLIEGLRGQLDGRADVQTIEALLRVLAPRIGRAESADC